jgi:hypothetical protein
MKGLAVVDGDLVLAGNSYLTLSGPAKITQDLTFAIKEAYGSDPFHPHWGSILDRFIGQPITATLQQQITDEVQRIVTNYIAVQTDMVNSAVSAGLVSQLDTSDVVQSVQNVDVQVTADKIAVTATLQAMSGASITVTRTVTA